MVRYGSAGIVACTSPVENVPAGSLRYAVVSTEWGEVLLAATADAVCGAALPSIRQDADREAQRRWPGAVRDDAILPAVQDQVRAYFAGERVTFCTPVHLDAVAPFRRRVLAACRKVEFGQMATYTDLAAAAGSPRAVRAAGGAMAHNPIPLIIPCHRILRSDGGLGGFSAPDGVGLKRRLLAWEAARTFVSIPA